MSFFLESKRNTDFQVPKNPAPTDYLVTPDRKKSSSYAPFNSTTKLSRTANKIQKQPNQIINDYQQQRAFMLDDKNIQILAQQRMQSMFKSRSQRIIFSHKNIPGPGSYQLRSKYKNEKGTRKQQFNQSASIRNTNPPSIPTDNLGYKYNQNNSLQKVRQKQVNPPVPGTYQIRKDLIKEHGLSWNTNVTASRKDDDVPTPGPGSYNYSSKSKIVNPTTSVFKSQLDRFNPKKIRKTNIPGPGQYQPQKKPLRQFSQSHFNSKVPRFKNGKSSNLGPGLYKQQSFNQSLKTFNKKIINGQTHTLQSNRKTLFNFDNKNPGPGQYIARQGMTFQLQKALLRKHNLTQFPNSHREVFVPNFENPGPGQYNPIKPKLHEKGNIGYSKVDVINLKQDEDVTSPSPLTYNVKNFQMAKKIEKSNQRITLTDKKPFNTGKQRFQHYSSTMKKQDNQRKITYDTDNNQSIDPQKTASINFEGPKRVKKLIMTSVKVKVPFGTSTNKFQQIQSNQIGPGYYNSDSNWVKKSYSLKGKLNKNK